MCARGEITLWPEILSRHPSDFTCVHGPGNHGRWNGFVSYVLENVSDTHNRAHNQTQLDKTGVWSRWYQLSQASLTLYHRGNLNLHFPIPWWTVIIGNQIQS